MQPDTTSDGPTARTDAPATRAAGPTVRVLSPEECEAMLRRHVVGRIAFAFDRRVEILPIHFVYDEGWLYGRTSPGDKIDMWRHSPWVAFEVDEVRGVFEWTSVVVHGALYLLSAEGTTAGASAWKRAVELLRRVVPGSGTAHDPVPGRTIVFRIHADELTGRSATPSPAA